MKKKLFLPLLLTAIYFLAALFTLKDYGISWDETIHFSRGQAFLYYFLTGKTNYQDLAKVNLQGTLGKPENVPTPRRSYYQLDSESLDGDFYIKVVAHPPLNDNLAALSNYIFYQKLGIMDDIASHHLFNITTGALLVFIVVFFAQETLGAFSAIISFLALCTYPLFWAESHFNIKDFPEAAFFAGFIWAFYNSLKGFSVKWLALSILFFGFALGTKFNVFFAIPVILVFMLLKYGKNLFRFIFSAPKRYLLLLFLAPLISLGILTLSWPLLWHNWLDNFIKVIGYYRGVGTLVNYQPPSFYIFGFNTFPILWILFTTPPATLILFFVGTISVFLKRKEKGLVLILWFLWFLIPIIRVTVPGSSIYGGIRQVSEYLPAMVLLSGLGANQIAKRFKRSRVVMALLVLVFIWPVIVLFKLHPNENVYFNSLIGGLKGASEKNFPSWGNSFGNAYLQGIKWLNQNVAYGAKLSLIQGVYLNAPPILIRKDIDFRPETWSGLKRGGEYLMELTFNDTARESNYVWEYVDKFLIPVYEVKVEGIPILKIWKNDIKYTNENFLFKEKMYQGNLKVGLSDRIISMDFGEEALISHVELDFTGIIGCSLSGNVDTSIDGENWVREKDGFPQLQIGQRSGVIGNTVTYYFAARKARQIRFWFDESNLCQFKKPQVKVYLLEQFL